MSCIYRLISHGFVLEYWAFSPKLATRKLRGFLETGQDYAFVSEMTKGVLFWQKLSRFPRCSMLKKEKLHAYFMHGSKTCISTMLHLNLTLKEQLIGTIIIKFMKLIFELREIEICSRFFTNTKVKFIRRQTNEVAHSFTRTNISYANFRLFSFFREVSVYSLKYLIVSQGIRQFPSLKENLNIRRTR